MIADCIDARSATDLVACRIADADRAAVELHLTTCERCRKLVEIARQASTALGAGIEQIADGEGSGPVVGEAVGRYVIEAQIGRGGMGAVYRASDPALGRAVAIKLLRSDRAGSDVLEQRLVRESQAMAKLAHPNVLTVYDIGRFDGQVFIAMELASGGTLREWLDGARRDWREIVARFAMAGRGLRAAHDSGLVHRDFKPDNVLLTADGDVLVADFGLVGNINPASGTDGPPGDTAAPGTLGLTHVGARMGTPLYMAPEQHEGGRAGTAADQFAFGVSLYEALYGEHPFGGDTWLELAIAVGSGALRRAPVPTDVPPALRKIVVRALRVDPQERWPSMTPLIEALDALPRKPAVIEPADPALRARAAILRHALDDASALAEGGQYDDALPRLTTIATDAAALGHPPLTADALYALGALQTNLGDLRGAETTLNAAAIEAARAHDDALSARVWSELLVVIGYRAGRIADAMLLRTAAEAAFARCDDDALAQGQYLNTVGLMHENRGHYAEALAAFERAAAVFEDGFGPASPQLGRALNNVGYTLRRLGRYVEARGYYERAHQIHETALGPEHPWVAISINNLGELAAEVGTPELALVHHLRARAIRERVLRPDHAHLALSIHNVGMTLLALGRVAEARVELARALAIRTSTLGDQHADVADSLAGLGAALVAEGAWQAGLEHHERALAIATRTAGADHPRVAAIEDEIGDALRSAGQFEAALVHYERALGIIIAALGPDHPHVGRSILGITAANDALGRPGELAAFEARARAIDQASGRLSAS